MVIAAEDYLSLCRLVKSGEKVKMDIEVQTAFQNNNTKGYNVIAEIPGTDPKLKAEIVMLGGHLDSWQGSTGATDNAAGCAVMMEAVRILKAAGLQPKRTIRIALWSGEEQGILGSKGYVKNEFSDSIARKNFNVYFNMDNGTGKFRGIYLQGNEAAGPVFAKWLEPFHDNGAKTVTISNTGGTDHLSFDAEGLPGFQFIQDPIEYDTRTHHTNMDSYDHLIAEDLMHNSVIVASFIYHAANSSEKIPRKVKKI
jgi:carboxypeptidase Q